MHLDITEKFGTGILTPNGYRMHYLLGQSIRNLYPGLFGPGSNTQLKDIEVWASVVARTQFSAQSQLAGLFPEDTGETISTPNSKELYSPPFQGVDYDWPESDTGAVPFKFRLIPLTIPSEDMDYYFFPNMIKNCPKAGKYSEEFDPKVHKKFDYLLEMNKLGDRLEARGFKSEEIYKILLWNTNVTALFSDEMITYRNYYGKFYKDFDGKLMEDVFRIHNVKFTVEFNETRILRLRGDKVARGILQGMEDFIDDKPGKKVFRLYSGHDTGVHSHILLSGLTSLECMVQKAEGKSVTGECEDIPDFAAQFLYELATSDGQYFVKTIYNGKVFSICEKGLEYCPFDRWKKKYAEMFFMDPDEFDEFCGNPYILALRKEERIRFIKPISTLIIILVGSALVLFMILVVAIKMNNLRKMENTAKTALDNDNEADNNTIAYSNPANEGPRSFA